MEKKFINESIDPLQKINLSMDIENINEIIKKETQSELKNIKKGLKKTKGSKKTLIKG